MLSKTEIIVKEHTSSSIEGLMHEYLETNFYELSVSCFLEDSAKYFGVFYEQDPHGDKDEKYLIN